MPKICDIIDTFVQSINRVTVIDFIIPSGDCCFALQSAAVQCVICAIK
jgi:hypothetical protein